MTDESGKSGIFAYLRSVPKRYLISGLFFPAITWLVLLDDMLKPLNNSIRLSAWLSAFLSYWRDALHWVFDTLVAVAAAILPFEPFDVPSPIPETVTLLGLLYFSFRNRKSVLSKNNNKKPAVEIIFNLNWSWEDLEKKHHLIQWAYATFCFIEFSIIIYFCAFFLVILFGINPYWSIIIFIILFFSYWYRAMQSFRLDDSYYKYLDSLEEKVDETFITFVIHTCSRLVTLCLVIIVFSSFLEIALPDLKRAVQESEEAAGLNASK